MVALNGSEWYDLVADIAIRLVILAPMYIEIFFIFVLKRVRTTGKRERMCREKQHTCSETSDLGHWKSDAWPDVVTQSSQLLFFF